MELKTKRLLIRKIEAHDAISLYKYRHDKEVNKYQSWIPKTIEECNFFIKKRVNDRINVPNTWFQFVLIKKNSYELIGDIGLHFIGDDGHLVELGFTIAKEHQKKNYAYEALQTIISYLFNVLNKHRIIISSDPANIGSIKLAEKLGFRKEAHFKESLIVNGVWVDDLIYAILNKEWKVHII